MGFKSGEYGGRYRSSQPCSSISSLTLSPLWALRGCPSPQPDRDIAWVRESSAHKLRTLRGWSNLPPPEKLPYLEAHTREQSRVRPSVTRNGALRPLSLRRIGIDRRKRSIGSHLIYDEHEPLRINLLGERHPPGGSEPLVPFCCTHTPFFGSIPGVSTAARWWSNSGALR